MSTNTDIITAVEILHEYDDGGRSAAGFVGDAGDCVTRAIAIAGGLDYQTVYDDLAARMAARGKPRSARNGIDPAVYKAWFAEHGWTWTACTGIGQGCRVHLRAAEIPSRGSHVMRLSKHLCAVVNGVVRDTYDPSRCGTRCVYGYWTAPGGAS